MCGIAGLVRSSGNAIYDLLTVLAAENNRGEQACGVAAYDGRTTRRYCGPGKVSEVFGNRDRKKWTKIVGPVAIGHDLYSTNDIVGATGHQSKTMHPLFFSFHGRRGALAHNGNIVRLDGFRRRATKAGYKFKSRKSDTEVIAAMLSTSKEKNFLQALVRVCRELENHGAFSLVLIFDGKLIGVRCGIRPLCIGKKHGKNGESDSYIFASESCVFPALEATEFKREVYPGELVVLGPGGYERSVKWGTRERPGFCVCEFLYFARPATCFFNVNVSDFRFVAGKMSARYHPVEADLITPIPNSGKHYSDGFAAESGIPAREAIEKCHYDIRNRTFMEAREINRGSKQRRRLQVIRSAMSGKRVCGTEDTIFRASVAPMVVKMAKEHGNAREFHLRICSPPACCPCHLGMDTSTSEELVASRMTVEEIRDKIVHSDSLEYLTLEELKQALTEVGLDPEDFCLGCFTGKYPVPPPKQ